MEPNLCHCINLHVEENKLNNLKVVQHGKMWHCTLMSGISRPYLVAEVEVETRIVSSGEKLAIGQDESVAQSACLFIGKLPNRVGLPPWHLPVSNFFTLITPPTIALINK